jgi:hypothetical protein
MVEFDDIIVGGRSAGAVFIARPSEDPSRHVQSPVADELVIAVGTSERHVADILRKLDASSILDLVLSWRLGDRALLRRRRAFSGSEPGLWTSTRVRRPSTSVPRMIHPSRWSVGSRYW